MKLLNLNLNCSLPNRFFDKNPNCITRLKILKQKINFLEPDILTFQEVVDVFMVKKLKLMFRKYNLSASYQLKNIGGLVTFYHKDNWFLKTMQFQAFSKQGKFLSMQLTDRLLKKGMLITLLENKKTHHRLLTINTHLTACYGGNLLNEKDKPLLNIELKEIKQVIEKNFALTKNMVIMGDFNANFYCKTIQDWIKDIGFKPAFTDIACTVCPEHNPLCYRSQHKSYLIDNILVKNLNIIKASLIFNQEGEFISDHYGQLVKLED